MEKNPSLDAELDVYSVTARPLPNRKPPTKRLGELALYTAAAGSAFALAPVAEASIIYSGIRDITLHRTTNAPSSAFVDLNGNGERDFAIFISSHLLPSHQLDFAVVEGTPIASPGFYGSARFFADNNGGLLKLAASSRDVGANYGPNTNLAYQANLRQHSVTASGRSSAFGLWNPGPNASSTGFAGVRVGSRNTTAKQFGWLHFKLTTDAENRTASLTLIDWAFESVPGVSIHVGDKGTPPSVPEPSTLSLLALGVAGLAALRRRRGRGEAGERLH